ncbi:MAG: DHH family phosphoesterase [Bacilli bacterium]|nr:DHH family phosphoesterase [Bacilli bacterium]
MKKTFKKFRNFIALTLVFELALVAAFFVFYFIPLFNFDKIITVPIIVIVMSALLVINLLIIWCFYVKFNKMRTSSDLKAADLIGGDVQEAYNFGQIGLVVVDENNTVLWINEVFKDRGFDIIDQNIYEWQPRLKELDTAKLDTTIQIEISSRNYDIKFLSDAGLYIFKDSTEYEQLFSYNRDQSTVVGIIMIDNYSDVSGINDDATDTITKVRNAIFEYAKKFNVLLRRYRNDGYFMLCNHKSLEAMEKDKFSLLETIHTLGEKEEAIPTLSIGIAHNITDVVKLNEMASNAIDIALSRGGDQVVVSKYGEELAYYGGKTEAIEARNKVKVRIMANAVLNLIKNSTDVLIMGHSTADMDSIGACFGMKAMCDYLNKPARIVYDPKLVESKTRSAVTTSFTREELQKIMITPADAVSEVRSNTLVIVVDVHKPSMTMSPALLEAASKVMVIDHHRRGEEFIESPVFSHIDPSASSASELIAEFIHYCSVNPKIEIPSSYATIMLSGIFMDTQYFKSKTCGIRTFEASMILKEFGADNSKADDFLKDEFEEYSLITKIISTLETPYYGVVYCVADEDMLIEQATLAKVGNTCMQMKGINASFVIGHTGNKMTKISCRSDGSINVQLIAEKLGGGGHFTAAAAAFPDTTIAVVESKLLEVLEDYLPSARNTNN